jgi:hypothetical protein
MIPVSVSKERAQLQHQICRKCIAHRRHFVQPPSTICIIPCGCAGARLIVRGQSPVLFGTGKSERRSWFYFTESELSRGAVRVNNYKFLFNLRGDDGASTGGLAVDTNLGWKGAEKYVATVPQVFDLWQDPQERYEIFMNNFTESTWMGVVMEQELKRIMATYVKYPPRKVQSYGYTGSITLSNYEKFQSVREAQKQGITIPMPTEN